MNDKGGPGRHKAIIRTKDNKIKQLHLYEQLATNRAFVPTVLEHQVKAVNWVTEKARNQPIRTQLQIDQNVVIGYIDQ